MFIYCLCIRVHSIPFYFTYLFIYALILHTRVCGHTCAVCGDQSTVCGNCFSLSTVCLQGIKLRQTGLQVSVSTAGTFHCLPFGFQNYDREVGKGAIKRYLVENGWNMCCVEDVYSSYSFRNIQDHIQTQKPFS